MPTKKVKAKAKKEKKGGSLFHSLPYKSDLAARIKNGGKKKTKKKTTKKKGSGFIDKIIKGLAAAGAVMVSK